MKRCTVLLFGLLAVAWAPVPCSAQWGWPPPGYSPTGVRACDGSHYRGLCAVWRDRRRGIRPGWCGDCGLPAALSPAAAPTAPGAAPVPDTVPQAPSPPGGSRP
jgi:hypothetical protein